MGAEKQAELTRIVALRGCGHVAAFASVEELLRGKDRCPLCAARVSGDGPPLPEGAVTRPASRWSTAEGHGG